MLHSKLEDGINSINSFKKLPFHNHPTPAFCHLAAPFHLLQIAPTSPSPLLNPPMSLLKIYQVAFSSIPRIPSHPYYASRPNHITHPISFILHIPSHPYYASRPIHGCHASSPIHGCHAPGPIYGCQASRSIHAMHPVRSMTCITRLPIHRCHASIIILA